MNKRTAYFLLAYCGWATITLFIHLMPGRMWILYVPLVFIPIMFLILEDVKMRKAIAGLLIIGTLALIIVDLENGREYERSLGRLRLDLFKRSLAENQSESTLSNTQINRNIHFNGTRNESE